MSHRLALGLLAALALLSMAAILAVVLASGDGGAGTLLSGIAARLEAHRTTALALFVAWALAANLIVIPSGSATLVLAGFFAGPWLPAAVWWGAQIVTAPIVHRIGGGSVDPAIVQRWLGHALPRGSQEALRNATGREALFTSAMLRLTPLLPSAPAALVAAAVGIPATTFTLATVAVGWMRPLYFTSLGATLPALGDPTELLTWQTLLPLGGLFALSVAVVAIRVWLDRRRPPG